MKIKVKIRIIIFTNNLRREMTKPFNFLTGGPSVVAGGKGPMVSSSFGSSPARSVIVNCQRTAELEVTDDLSRNAEIRYNYIYLVNFVRRGVKEYIM